MARNTDNSAHRRGMQKAQRKPIQAVTPPPLTKDRKKRLRRRISVEVTSDPAPVTKNKKRRLQRRISSGSPQPPAELRRQGGTPTFYQLPSHPPRPDLPSSRGGPSRPMAQFRDPDEGGEGGEDEGEDDDDEESEGTMLEQLEKLPSDQRYRAIGKMFALKIWAWPSSSWWIGDEVVERPPARRVSQAEDFVLRRKKLDAMKQREFSGFLFVDMGISRDEWMVPIFKSEFQLGARSFRSEIVGLLKKNAISVFQINDIRADDFFKEKPRAASLQLKSLRVQNAFLYATEEDLPGSLKIERYFRSECIARALRLVLLGQRAIDGSNKRRRSQSRMQKFAVIEVPKSLLAFITTVLFFLLDDQSTSFNEDDDRFRNFFDNRYVSLTEGLRKDVPEVLKETMRWLTSEVFDQEDDEEQAQIDEEQEAFEEELESDIKAARDELRRRRELALEDLYDEAGVEGDGGMEGDDGMEG